MFSIEAGPYHPVTHNQADKGHFNFYGLGYKWAVDTGYGNNQEPEGRDSTFAHSCVLIDNKGQALSGAGLGTDGKVLHFENTPRYGYALIDAKSAYNKDDKGRVGVPVSKALRHVFFIRPSENPRIPAYAVVLDDIEWDQRQHQFTWQMIAWKEMEIQALGSDAFVLKPGTGPTDPQMKVLLEASAPLRLSVDPYTPDQHPVGGRPPNDYQRLRGVATAQNPHFVAVLAPLPVGATAPTLSVENTPAGKLVQINWGARTDTIVWNQDEAKLR